MQSYYYLAWRPTEEIGRYATALIAELKDRFGHVGISRKTVGPHVTLVPPFATRHLETVKQLLEETVSGIKPMKIQVNGFDCFNKKNKVIFLSIEVPKEFSDLKLKLTRALNASLPDLERPIREETQLVWHLTVAYQEINEKFDEIWAYLQEKEKPVLTETMATLTIVGTGRIWETQFKEES